MLIFDIKWFLWIIEEQVDNTIEKYIFSYFLLIGLISFAYCLYRDPIPDQRRKKFVNFFFKFIGMVFIYFSFSYDEISLSVIITYIVIKFKKMYQFLKD